LKKLVAERELCLAELSQLLPKKFEDYRDFYPLACLCVEGMARTEVRIQNSDEKLEEKFLASYFFAHTLGIGTHKVNMYTSINRGDEGSRIMVHATGKADAYLSDRKAKVEERIITTVIGFILGVATTVLGQWIKTVWLGQF